MSDLLRVADTVPCGSENLPFLGRGNIWVKDTVEDRLSLLLTQQMIQHALANSSPGQVEVTVFDEALSGVASPFAAANGGGDRLVHTVNRPDEFLGILSYLRDHVQAVNNVIQGLADNLTDFRREVGYPVESYKLIVLSVDVSSLDDRILDTLSVLMKAGPPAGVTFLVHSMILGVNPYLQALCRVVEIDAGTLTVDHRAVEACWKPVRAQELIITAEYVARSLSTAMAKPIPFSEIQDTSRLWTESSRDGLHFAVGRYGRDIVEISIGDEVNQRHNLLVTGAVGQGKSNLISVIVHSLCQRYSPDELELYLLDFKEGVTLQQYIDEDSGVYLPHARVLGLEADREFGLNVFRRLFSIYKGRMALFKSAGVQGINSYRKLHPEARLPRILLVIDEFQLMFSEQDRIGSEIADLLGKGARLFRASGIHILLASQTIGGNMALMGSAGEGLFGQVPVRLALKNSLQESHATLGIKNDAAAHLHSREAVVNLEYGDVSSNRKTSIAYADENILKKIRREWWQADPGQDPPYVFRGERPRSLKDDASVIRGLIGEGPRALLGATMMVDGRPLSIALDREIGRNIVFLGTARGVDEFVSAALSIAATVGPSCRFCIFDLMSGDPIWDTGRAELLTGLESVGCEIVSIMKDQVPGFVDTLALDLQRPDSEALPTTFILAFGLDRCRDLPTSFQDVCRLGPQAGTHVIGWWMKLDSFQNQIGYGGESYFDVRVAMQSDAQSVKSLMNDPLLEWSAQSNRALVWDVTAMPGPATVIPYSSPKSTRANH